MDIMEKDVIFMQAAIELAREAALDGEVPVGAVIVRNGEIVGRGRNRREKAKNALAHAEVEAINEACSRLGGWRLPECTMYVTLEPCPMCAGGLVNARIERLVVALADAKSGAFRSVMNLNSYPLNHKIKTEFGLMETESRALMTEFFAALRARIGKNNAKNE